MQTVTETTSGPVRGREKEGVLLFAGIPYAAPPVGGLRFRAAQPHPGWREVRDATKFGAAAPQHPSGLITDPVAPQWSEDCLTLNIATPAIDDARRPVLVWIHGGGYQTGQSAIPWYNGARFAANGGIVVVSINYRLGALGFADLSRFGDEFATSGVNGILDQITALGWVHENIARFGGDPERVTIAGESAGGFSVATVMSSPRAEGLFRGAIPQSGAGHHSLPPEASARITDMFLEELSAHGPLDVEAADVTSILEAQARVMAAVTGARVASANALGLYVSPFYPVFGNEILPDAPIDAIRKGRGSFAKVLIGTNRDETTLFVGEKGFGAPEDVAEGYGDGRLIEAYRRSRPDASDHELSVALTSDHMFRIPALRLAEARVAHGGAPTWVYQFNWRSRAFGGRLGATHALEIPFAFDNLDRPGVQEFLGEGEVPQHVADAMHAAWTKFIRDGDPGWPLYELETRATMIFDDASRVENDPARAEREAWAGLR